MFQFFKTVLFLLFPLAHYACYFYWFSYKVCVCVLGFLRPICLSEKCSDPDEYAEEEFTMVGYGYDEANDQCKLNPLANVVLLEIFKNLLFS